MRNAIIDNDYKHLLTQIVCLLSFIGQQLIIIDV